jgi:hypothetical protein
MTRIPGQVYRFWVGQVTVLINWLFKGMVLAQMPGQIFALKTYYLQSWRPYEHTHPTLKI